MVTTRLEAIHIMSILHRYMPEKDAYRMISDMEFEVAENTDNESLKESIKLVKKYMTPSTPPGDNLYMCNCEHGHQNCTCDGNGNKRNAAS